VSSANIAAKYGRSAIPALLEAMKTFETNKEWVLLERAIVAVGLNEDARSKAPLLELAEMVTAPESTRIIALDALGRLVLSDQDAKKVWALHRSKSIELRLLALATYAEQTGDCGALRDFLDDFTFSVMVSSGTSTSDAVGTDVTLENGWPHGFVLRTFGIAGGPPELSKDAVTLAYDRLPHLTWSKEARAFRVTPATPTVTGDPGAAEHDNVGTLIEDMSRAKNRKDFARIGATAQRMAAAKGGFAAARSMADIILDDAFWGKDIGAEEQRYIKRLMASMVELGPSAKSAIIKVVVERNDCRRIIAVQSLGVMMGNDLARHLLLARAGIEGQEKIKSQLLDAVKLLPE
jgi:hypothetical protein